MIKAWVTMCKDMFKSTLILILRCLNFIDAHLPIKASLVFITSKHFYCI